MTSPDAPSSHAQHAATPPTPHANEETHGRETDFALTEYGALREEILKWIELQSRLLSLTVISFGAIVSVGFQTRNPAVIAIHPVLALILGIHWLNHTAAAVRVADYIRTHIETRFYKAWEHYVLRYPISHARIGRLGERAIFPGSSIVAVLVALYIGHGNAANIAAITTSALVTTVTIVLFSTYREGSFTPSVQLREARNKIGSAPTSHTIIADTPARQPVPADQSQ